MMHYEINVSNKNGHVFATAERSLPTLQDAQRVYALLKQKFPASEGYDVQCTYWEVKGSLVTFEKVEV